MGWTYEANSAADKDRVRRLIGDTVATAPVDERLEDEEITDFVAIEGSYRAGAALAARALAGKLLRKASEKQVGNLRLVYQQRHQGLMQLADSLAAAADAASARAALPYAGGISISDREIDETDTDRVRPGFTTGMLDNPREKGGE